MSWRQPRLGSFAGRMIGGVVLAGALVACGQRVPADADPHAEHAEHAEHAQHAEPAPGATAGLHIELNDGARWQMDEHTRAVLAETRATLADARVTTLEDAHRLGATLRAQNDRLIRGCTMSGPAHDALHHYLEAWIPTVAAIEGAGDLEAARATVEKARALLAEADRAFE